MFSMFKPVVQNRVFMLTNRQYVRRFSLLTGVTIGSLVVFEVGRQYMLNRSDIFTQEYSLLAENPNFYHTLHEQVALGLDVKAIEAKERSMQITRLRAQLAGKAQGLVLETNIGASLNFQFYNMSAVRRFIGVDWVTSTNRKAEAKAGNSKEVTIINCDVHKTPFSDSSFDTVVDTFGLECSYDLEK